MMVLHSVITWSLGLPSGTQVAFEVSVAKYHIEVHQDRGATNADFQVWKLFCSLCETLNLVLGFLLPLMSQFHILLCWLVVGISGPSTAIL
jgi:hypothetical protein